MRPLVGDGPDDIFDIALTVWQRATTEESDERQQERQYRYRAIDPLVFKTPYNTMAEANEAVTTHEKHVFWEWSIGTFEKTIFSGIVFAGVRMNDTNLHANVSFEVPTEIL